MKQSAFISALKFVAHAKAKNDLRHYINTVLFEVRNGVHTLVATDGHRMAWAEVEAEGIPEGDWLLDGAGVDGLLKTFKANSTGTIVFGFGADRVLVESGAGLAAVKLVDGKFPDWRRVAHPPAGEPDPAKHINCDYLADAGKAFSPLLGKYGCAVLAVGPVDACVSLSAPEIATAGVLSAQCIIMPMRA